MTLRPSRPLHLLVPIEVYDRFRDAADEEHMTYAGMLDTLLDLRDEKMGRGGAVGADLRGQQAHPLHIPAYPVSGYPGASHGGA